MVTSDPRQLSQAIWGESNFRIEKPRGQEEHAYVQEGPQIDSRRSLNYRLRQPGCCAIPWRRRWRWNARKPNLQSASQLQQQRRDHRRNCRWRSGGWRIAVLETP